MLESQQNNWGNLESLCTYLIYLFTFFPGRGDTWHTLRKMLSPAFTTGKLKTMLEPIEGICDKAMDHISKQVEKNQELDMKPVIQGFTLDSIAKVAFGLETNCHRGENQEFAKTSFDVFKIFIATDNWPLVVMLNVFL